MTADGISSTEIIERVAESEEQGQTAHNMRHLSEPRWRSLPKIHRVIVTSAREDEYVQADLDVFSPQDKFMVGKNRIRVKKKNADEKLNEFQMIGFVFEELDNIVFNFSFSHCVFKRLVLQTRKNQGLFGKGLSCQSSTKHSVSSMVS